MRTGRNLLAGVLLAVALSATGSSALAHTNGPGAPIVAAGTSRRASPRTRRARRVPGAPHRGTTTGRTRSLSRAPRGRRAGRTSRRRRDGRTITPRVADWGTATGKTVWWKWTAPASGNYVFDTAGSELERHRARRLHRLERRRAHRGDGGRRLDDLAHEPRLFRRRGRHGLLGPGRELQRRNAGRDRTGLAAKCGRERRVRPSHDDLRFDRSTNSTNAGATLDLGEPSDGRFVDASVWYSWTPAVDGDATLTLTSGFSGWAAVYTGGAVGALDAVFQRTDDSPLTARFSATAGTTYAIQVGRPTVTPRERSRSDGRSRPCRGRRRSTRRRPANTSVALAWSAPVV